jgi:hypothetical protein
MSTPSTSRFQREPVGSAAPKSTTEANSMTAEHTNGPDGATAADLQALQERARKAQDRRVRREVERDRAQADVAECAAQAQALGAKNPEELEALIRTIEEEDRAALEAFTKALEAEEALLDEVDQKLTLADTLES